MTVRPSLSLEELLDAVASSVADDYLAHVRDFSPTTLEGTAERLAGTLNKTPDFTKAVVARISQLAKAKVTTVLGGGQESASAHETQEQDEDHRKLEWLLNEPVSSHVLGLSGSLIKDLRDFTSIRELVLCTPEQVKERARNNRVAIPILTSHLQDIGLRLGYKSEEDIRFAKTPDFSLEHTPVPQEFLDALTLRARKALDRLGALRSLEALQSLKEIRFYRMGNCGDKTMDDIRTALTTIDIVMPEK